MDIGLFLPINNNGWLVSTTAPQYHPSFEMSKQLVQAAEDVGFDFALSMIKLRGLGGRTQFWDYGLESFTLMAGLAACTSRIKLYASSPILAQNPAIVARMASTVDSIAPGRFGINIVTGWLRPEYEQMGLWPGDEHFEKRYEFAREYITVVRELWADGVSDFKGDYFSMADCRMLPRPSAPIPIVCAGQSSTGIDFSARFADYNFVLGSGINNPAGHADKAEALVAATKITGRNVGAYVLLMVIADETDEAAQARWDHYQDGIDLDAIGWSAGQASADPKSKLAEDSSSKRAATGAFTANLGMGTMIGSYETVARFLDEVAATPGTSGIMLTFDEFLPGVRAFGDRIQPLMVSRSGRR